MLYGTQWREQEQGFLYKNDGTWNSQLLLYYPYQKTAALLEDNVKSSQQDCLKWG